MHGYTASMYAIAEESRWYDVAEQNGFIVVFAQGLVRPADLMGNIPTAMWLAGPFAALAGKDTDPSVDLEFINSLLDRMERDYSIDTTRVYATGHSNGSLMTWATACRYASRFAAIAPVGYMFAPLPELDPAVLLPTWAFLGEYDSAGVAELVEDNGTVKALQGWNAHQRHQRGSCCRKHLLRWRFCDQELYGWQRSAGAVHRGQGYPSRLPAGGERCHLG